MTRPASADTTHPAPNTGQEGSEAGLIVVQWLHPALLTSPLVDGVIFGRDASATVRLSGHEASRRHAEVRRAGPVPILRDLESRNGTWVNGHRITERPIGPGDVLRIGEWTGIVLELPENGVTPALQELGMNWYGSATLARVVEPVRRVATTDLPVIVEGETGVGKEGMARALHTWSARSGPFVAVNCAAIPAAMAEGELFGYRKGAFTGADRSNPGYFRAAHGGTLFLDEVLELPPPVQSKLLRVLEQHEVQPLGEASPVSVDVRVVCATQEPLAQAVSDRRFRADLRARLDGLTVVLPPLRSRREDIFPLFTRILRDHCGDRIPEVDPKLVEALLLYDWPLNIRELVLLVRQLVAIHGNERLWRRSMLPERLRETPSEASASHRHPTPVRASTSDEVAFDQLVDAIRQHGGNVSGAAAALGISRSRAYRLLEAHPGFDIRSIRDEPES